VRRFAAERVAPGFLARDKSRDLDRLLLAEMGELGFICPELPEPFGGLGMGCLAAGVIHEAIARADLSFSYLNLLASLNAQIRSKYGAPAVVGPWLKKFGVWAPPNGTPPEITARLTRELNKALATATLKQRFADLGAEPASLDAAAFRKLLAVEGRTLAALIKDRKIVVE